MDYVITYELGGGKNNEANPTSYTVESESVSLAQPLKYGYAFKGWYYDGQQIDPVNPAWSRNVTLTAKWQIDPDSTCFTYGDNYTITGLKDNSVKDIFIPDYVTAIAAEAFLMTEIQSLQFAEDSACTSVGEYAFEGCEKLITVKIPASIESVGICTFYMCTSLQTLEFAENSKLERIPGGMLNDCYALTSLRLPSGITEIEDAAIAGCTSLEEVTFAQDSKLQRIGDYNFIQCKSLKSIVIPRNVSYIGQAAEYTLDEIYYIGDANEWSAIAGASSFTRDATVYYYSANQPAQAGNYWHYDENGVPVIW